MSAEHENEQISELLQRAQEDAKDTSASSDDSVSDAAAKESVKDDSEAFADAFATSEESTRAHTGGKIGKIHTITLENGKKQKVVEFYYEGGIKEFVAYLNKSKDPLYENILYFEGEKNNVYVEVSFQHNDSYNESVFSFVNNINTPEGGTHLQGFRNAITKTFNDYARSAKLLKDSEPNLSGEDIREGLTAIVSVKIEDPQFEGQTKQKLGNSEARGAVDNIVSEQLTYFLEQNPQIAKEICEKLELEAENQHFNREHYLHIYANFLLLQDETDVLDRVFALNKRFPSSLRQNIVRNKIQAQIRQKKVYKYKFETINQMIGREIFMTKREKLKREKIANGTTREQIAEKNYQKVIEYYKKGLKQVEICELTKLTKGRVSQMIKQYKAESLEYKL